MNAADEGGYLLDSASVMNAKTTLLELLGRAGVFRDEAEELIALVEAGALAGAHREVGEIEGSAPEGKGEPYTTGWLAGARAVGDALHRAAESALGRAVQEEEEPDTPHVHPPVGRVDVERAKVAVTPLYLSFTHLSELDPEVSQEVLSAVLGTMSASERGGYAGRLEEFAESRHAQLALLYDRYGPGSDVAIHGRYSLLHSPTSVAVLERLTTEPSALRAEWEHAELPPVWLEGLAKAWGAAQPE
ncbi:hypothetical protein [Streptomyces vilmorinianum]|uniref:hypothetical protein n=1 Tax=Streptomyces vilmorinianum TaxID=3051092 RepID=UPI0010FB2146|nr:hypothetical protein [Streptomyces vilmorinianum]